MRAGQWQQALSLFRSMRSMRSTDALGYSLGVSAAERLTRWAEALSLLEAIWHNELPLSRRSYNACLSGCGKSSEWRKTLRLLSGMASSHLQPDVISFSSAISSCERAAAWQHAVRVFDQMLQAQIQADALSYSVHSGASSTASAPTDTLFVGQALVEQPSPSTGDSSEANERSASSSSRGEELSCAEREAWQ
ncbi:unnamed protein product [Durusdinium trenchii]|uniref:Uncharacterized protein n=1 Tax=Durusdinium trenchii TaxID=1381693 RepID=A0ABP0N7L4_9DINO